MLLNTRKQDMLSIDSIVVVTRKQCQSINRMLSENKNALDADYAEFGHMDNQCTWCVWQ